MRDDLHRTPALLRPWRAAVRHAAREADADRVAHDMARAATHQMDAGIRAEWLSGVKAALGTNHGQLFPESRVDSLCDLENTARHPLEQKLIEAARGVCLRDPQDLDVVESARHAVFSQLIDQGIEHCAAVTRTEHNASQAAQLRRSMASHRAECSMELGRQTRPRKSKGLDLLDLEAGTP